MLLCAAANRCLSQLKRRLVPADPDTGSGCGEVPTEYIPGCGTSDVLKSLNKRWHVRRAPASASPSASPRPSLYTVKSDGNAT